MSGSSTGLDPKVAGFLCYLVGVITGILFLLIEKEDDFVRFHAFQSTATFGGLFVLSLVIGFLPVVGSVGQVLLTPFTLLLWIVLMVKAFQGQRFKLPVVGDWAEDQL